MDMRDIKGQEHVKRGLEVALAGNHGVLLIGPPGSGKKMLIKATKGIGNIPIYTMEPCSCGYFTDPKRECNCTPSQIQAHLTKMIKEIPNVDIHIEVPRLRLDLLSDKRRGESSTTIRERIQKAQATTPIDCDKEADELLKLAILELGISAQAYDKILRVAGTIVRLDGKDVIEAHHISEAISYRSLDRNLWG